MTNITVIRCTSLISQAYIKDEIVYYVNPGIYDTLNIHWHNYISPSFIWLNENYKVNNKLFDISGYSMK